MAANEVQIDPRAVVDPRADLGRGVQVGPFAIIEAGAQVGDGGVIGPHAVLHGNATLGAECQISPHAVIGGDPQSLGFDLRTPSRVVLGAKVVVREGATIHRGTQADGATKVGESAYLMAYAHVGHDCVVGSRVILANNVMLAGCVTVQDFAFLGGGAAVHQFVRIGEGVMLSGLSRLTKDAPPFTMAAERDELVGLNLVGLKRRGFSRDAIAEIKKLFRQVCGTDENPAKVATKLTAATAEGERFLGFFQEGKRGFLRV